MLARQWVDDFNDAARAYSRERHASPVVKVTLVDGDFRFVQKIEAGPNDRLVTLTAFPDADDVLANMVAIERHEDGGTDYFAREAILVEPERIMKVELLYDRPQGRAIGFVMPDDLGT